MAVDTVRMSSKGQVVIPQGLREEIDANEGTLFAVVASKDTIVLKKVLTPSRDELIEELSSFAKKSRQKLTRKGFLEKDLNSK